MHLHAPRVSAASASSAASHCRGAISWPSTAQSDTAEQEVSDGGESALDNDAAHDTLLDTILSRKPERAAAGRSGHAEVVPEGAFNVSVAPDGTDGGLQISDLMNASTLSKVERKRLAKVAKGTSVSIRSLYQPLYALFYGVWTPMQV